MPAHVGTDVGAVGSDTTAPIAGCGRVGSVRSGNDRLSEQPTKAHMADQQPWTVGDSSDRSQLLAWRRADQ